MPRAASSRLITWAARLCFGTPLIVLGVSTYLWTTEHLAAKRVARVTAVQDVSQPEAPPFVRMTEPRRDGDQETLPMHARPAEHAGAIERAQVLDSARLELAAADPGTRVEGAAALASVGGEAVVPELIAALNDRDARVREEAVHALAGSSRDLALPALHLALQDSDAEVRSAALAELAELESSGADLALRTIAADARDPLQAKAADLLASK